MSRNILINSVGLFDTEDVIPINLTSMEWLFKNPEVVLWADEIILTDRVFEVLCENFFREDEFNQLALKTILEKFKKEGLIRTVSPQDNIPEITLRSVSEFVKNDFRAGTDEPNSDFEDGKWTPGMRRVEGIDMCPKALESLLLNLKVAQLLGCTCFMDSREREFLNQRYPKTSESFSNAGQMVFGDIYSVSLPNMVSHADSKAFCSPSRSRTCANYSSCLSEVPKRAIFLCDSLLTAREKPAIRKLAMHIDTLEQAIGNNPNEILSALYDDIRREQSRVYDLYPHVKRWARLIQGISVVGLASYGLPEGLIGAIPAVFGASIEFAVDFSEKKNEWMLDYAKPNR